MSGWLYRGFSYYPRENTAFFCLGAAFIRGWRLLVILLASAAFDRGRHLFDSRVTTFNGINTVLTCWILVPSRLIKYLYMLVLDVQNPTFVLSFAFPSVCDHIKFC